MRKRWIAVCAAAMLALGLTGCGGGDTSSGGGSGASGAQTDGGKAKGGTQYEFEQALYDQEDIKITATGYEIDENGFHSFMLKVQNDTDSIVAVDSTELVINGMVIQPHYNLLTSDSIGMSLSIQASVADDSGEDFEEFISGYYHTVPAGETEDIEMSLYLNEAQKECIGTIQKIDICMAAIKFTDMENHETLGAQDMPEGEAVSIQTDEFEGEVKLPELEGTEIYNQDGIRIVVMGMEYDEEYGDFGVNVYVENHSEKSIEVRNENASVNDFVTDMYMDLPLELEGGLRAAGSLVTMEELDIESLDDIENMEITFQIYDYETYDMIGSAVYTYAP